MMNILISMDRSLVMEKGLLTRKGSQISSHLLELETVLELVVVKADLVQRDLQLLKGSLDWVVAIWL